jgi:hypothetical protein
MSSFNPSPKQLVVSELIESGYIPDLDDALRLCHDLEEEEQTNGKLAIGLTATGIIGAGVTLAFCGAVAPLLVPIAAIGVGISGVWNHPIRASRRDDEADFLRANPAIIPLIEQKLNAGEVDFKVSSAYQECFRAWRNTGQPLALPTPQQPTQPESATASPATLAATAEQIGNATRFGAIEIETPAVAPGPETSSPAQTHPTETELFNPAIDLGQNPQSALIVGTPGSGKGMLVSNAVRLLREKAPTLKVMVIDPKGDSKEKGYWAPVADIYRSFCLMDCPDPDEGASWLLACMDEFRVLPEPKLLIFDELMASATELELADQKMKALPRLKKFIVGLIGQGDSRAVWLWAMTQSPQVKDLGISGGVRANLRVLGLVSPKNMTAVNALISTQLIPKPDGGIEELRSLMKASPVDRAFYDGKVSRWLPMPKLENHSGFDRDNRTIEASPTINNSDTPKTQEKPAQAPKQIEPESDLLDDELAEVELDKPSSEAMAQAKKEAFELGQAILELLKNNPDKSYSDESLRTHRFIREKLGKAPAISAIRQSIKTVSTTPFVQIVGEGRIQWK